MQTTAQSNKSEARQLRAKYGLNQAQAAEMLHLSVRQWRRLEAKPTLPKLYAEILVVKTVGLTPKK